MGSDDRIVILLEDWILQIAVREKPSAEEGAKPAADTIESSLTLLTRLRLDPFGRCAPFAQAPPGSAGESVFVLDVPSIRAFRIVVVAPGNWIVPVWYGARFNDSLLTVIVRDRRA